MDFPLTIEHVSVLTPTGLLLLSQHHYCDELSNESLAPSASKDLTTLSTSSKSPQKSSTQHDVPQTKTSTISTTTTHTTRLHRITVAPNDEALIDVTTSIDSLCLLKSFDADDTTDDNYSIKSISGDIVVTIILHQSTDNATEIIKFIVNHINEIDLLVHNVTIGESRVFSFQIVRYLMLIAFNFVRRSHCASCKTTKSLGHSGE